MTVNQKGRTERIFVNLEAVYPDPEVLGTELSLEELRAGHRGWLSKVWEPEFPAKGSSSALTSPSQNKEPDVQIVEITKGVSEKLVILRDPVGLDENGVVKDPPREGRGRRMKIKEVNETQISKSLLLRDTSCKFLTINSQGKTIITIRTKDKKTKGIQRTNHDITYSGSK